MTEHNLRCSATAYKRQWNGSTVTKVARYRVTLTVSSARETGCQGSIHHDLLAARALGTMYTTGTRAAK